MQSLELETKLLHCCISTLTNKKAQPHCTFTASADVSQAHGSAQGSVFHLPNARYCPVVLEFGLTQQQIHKQFVPSIPTPWFCNFGCQFFAGASNLSQLTEDTVSLMALSTRKTAALSMFLKSSFGVSTDTSISFLYTASNASSRYDQVLEYAPET